MLMQQNKRLIGILLAVPVLLAVPLVAMQFSKEVKWGPLDFVVMALLLTGVGLLCELVLRKAKTVTTRLLLIGACLLAFLLVWAELAVGIFGSPLAGS